MKRILFIDDDDLLRDYVSEKLKKLFLTEVLTASSGKEGISIIESNEQIDLIISDITMVDGNGSEVLSHLLKTNSKIPLVFFTGCVDTIICKEYSNFLGQVEKSSFDDLIKLIALYFSK